MSPHDGDAKAKEGKHLDHKQPQRSTSIDKSVKRGGSTGSATSEHKQEDKKR